MPGADGSDAERQALESKHTGKIAAALRAIMRKVVPPGTTVDNITSAIAIQRYRDASSLLRDALVAMLTDGVLLGAQVGGQQVEYLLGVRKATILGVDWDLINQDALAWVLSNPSQVGQGFGNGYANAVLSAMNTTSEQQLTTLVGEWIRNGLTYNSLIDQLERTVFSRQRAEMVSVTEITRAYAAGNQAAWRRSGIIKEMRWRTAFDSRTCPICSALNGTIVSIEGDFSNSLPEDQALPLYNYTSGQGAGTDRVTVTKRVNSARAVYSAECSGLQKYCGGSRMDVC
jgi:SPP1 gp7 family putative phage head morphogenesis protein